MLRPHVRRGGERAARHLAAAVATAFAVPTVTTVATQYAVPEPGAYSGLAALVVFGLPAALLGLVTAVWGAASLAWRAARDRPARR